MAKEKYIGIKFKAVNCGEFKPNFAEKKLIKALIIAGREYQALGFFDKNGGNLSARSAKGIIIKKTGAYPNKLKINDFVLVTKADSKAVYYYGLGQPSSEARLHQAIYQVRPEIKAILHAHDFVAAKSKSKIAGIGFIKEYSYGTMASALAAKKQAKKFDYFIQKNHGVVALGKSVKQAMNLIKNYHARFKKIAETSA